MKVKVRCRKTKIEMITPVGSSWMDSAVCKQCPNILGCKDGVMELELSDPSKEEKPKQKICPILMLSPAVTGDCRESDCAWWHPEYRKCSVLSIIEEMVCHNANR